MTRPLNVVGPLIQKFRLEKRWTQDELAARIGIAGWDISRGVLSHIEARLRAVRDYEILFIAKALGLPPAQLMPSTKASPGILKSFPPEQP